MLVVEIVTEAVASPGAAAQGGGGYEAVVVGSAAGSAGWLIYNYTGNCALNGSILDILHVV